MNKILNITKLFLVTMLLLVFMIACSSSNEKGENESLNEEPTKINVEDKDEDDKKTSNKKNEKIKKDKESKKKKHKYFVLNEKHESLNLREKPYLNSKSVGVVKPGDILKNINGVTKFDGERDWVKVIVNDYDGWVSKSYLDKVEKSEIEKIKKNHKEKNLNNKKENKSNIKNEQKEKQNNKVKKSKKETKNKSSKNIIGTKISGDYMPTQPLNIRSGPGINNNISGYANTGEKLQALESYKNGNTTWYKIKKSNGQVGWVGSGYLTKYSKSSTTQKQNTQSNKKNNQPNDTTNSNKNTSNNQNNTSSTNNYKPNHIYYNGKAVPYKNVGMGGNSAQNVIDTSSYAATFGGAATFSGTDGLNTHFVGHNGGPNQFGGMHTASTFIVTDSNGNAFKYVKSRMYIVDEYGMGEDGTNYYDRIVGTGGGERITLQSTKNHPWKYIVEAVPAK